MTPRVLTVCYEVPGYGGAATAAYRLFEVLAGQGLDVAHANLVEERDEDYYRFVLGPDWGNPRGRPGVRTLSLGDPLYGEQARLAELVRDVDPDVILAVGFVAARIVSLSAPERKLAFLATGCQQAKDAIVDGRARDAVSLEQAIRGSLRRPLVTSQEERQAVDAADVVFVPSALIESLFRAYFPFQTGKIYRDVIWFAEWIHGDALLFADRARPFDERDVDVLFVASSWQRSEKNRPFVAAIAAELDGAAVHVVGEIETPVPGAVHHGLVGDRAALFDLMGRARCVACPSTFDAAPGVLFEASALGCNVVASANCGNVALCHEDLRVDRFTPREFVARIRGALGRKLPDGIDRFLATRSVERLVETLAVL